jgi:hypothetical protein
MGRFRLAVAAESGERSGLETQRLGIKLVLGTDVRLEGGLEAPRIHERRRVVAGREILDDTLRDRVDALGAYSNEAGRFFLTEAGQSSEPKPDTQVYWLTVSIGSAS